MEKKSKEPNINSQSNPNNSSNSKSSGIFNTLFGDTPDDATSTSTFSDANLFRRKVDASSQAPPNNHPENLKNPLGLWFNIDIDIDVNTELKKRKRKKDEMENFDTQLIAEEIELSKKLKKNGEKEDFFDPNELLNSKGISKKVGKGSPEKNLESNIKLNEVNDNVGIINKKKRKRDELELEYEKKREEEHKEGGVVVGMKRKHMDNPEELMVSEEGFDDEEKLLRTVIIGNLPLKVKKKVLVNEFQQFGEIESVKIRSVPIEDGKTPRKGVTMKKQLNENAYRVHAFIVFKREDSVQVSLAHNMTVIKGNNIRVERACPPRKKVKISKKTLNINSEMEKGLNSKELKRKRKINEVVKQGGTKRKLENGTPDNTCHKKKPKI